MRFPLALHKDRSPTECCTTHCLSCVLQGFNSCLYYVRIVVQKSVELHFGILESCGQSQLHSIIMRWPTPQDRHEFLFRKKNSDSKVLIAEFLIPWRFRM